MTLKTEAKQWHIQNLKDAKVKRYDQRNHHFPVVICDVMKAYYSIYARNTWADIARYMVDKHLRTIDVSKGPCILVLVADLYSTPNKLRKVIRPKRDSAASSSKRKRGSDDEFNDPESTRDPPTDPEQLEYPPSDLNTLLRHHRWKTEVILPFLGREIKKLRYENVVIVLRGFCEEPKALSNPDTYDKTRSCGVVSVVPCENDPKYPEAFTTTAFDGISCPATAESDCAIPSMAGAFSDHLERILPTLTSKFRFDFSVTQNILVLSGDGDEHSIMLMYSMRHNLENIYLTVVEWDWEIKLTYNTHEAATKLMTLGFPDIYFYCALLYVQGCDYSEKLQRIGTETIAGHMGEYQLNGYKKRELIFHERSPFRKLPTQIHRDIYKLHNAVWLEGENNIPFLCHITWTSLIAFASNSKLAFCKCEPGKPSVCRNECIPPVDFNLKKTPDKLLSLHAITTLTSQLESTLKYFATEPDPLCKRSYCLKISKFSGYYVNEENKVVFGLIPLDRQFPKGLQYFLNAEESMLD